MIVDIDLSAVNVLIIDHSIYARSLLKSAMYSFGTRNVFEAGDVSTARAAMVDNRIDMVLVDYDIGPGGGLDFTRWIRRGGEVGNDEIPILMTSDMAEMERVTAARNTGVNEFLVKPLSADSLFRRVRNVLVNPRPFVRCDTYVGPCRRTVDRAPPGGVERRVNPPLPKPESLVRVPPGIAQPTVRRAQQQGYQAAMEGGADKAMRKRFAAGAVIFREGDAGDDAYVLESGRVTIFKEAGGARVVLGEIGPQGIFGEMALIDDSPRMATALAVEECVCQAIPKAALKAQINRTPDLVILVVETLLHDIRKMGRELGEIRARVVARRREAATAED